MAKAGWQDVWTCGRVVKLHPAVVAQAGGELLTGGSEGADGQQRGR